MRGQASRENAETLPGKAAVEDRERRRARNAGSSAGKSKVRKRPAVSEDGQERPKKRRPIPEDGQERPKKRPQKAEKISKNQKKAGGTAGSKKSADKTQAKKTCRIDDSIIDHTWDSRNCRSISVEEVQSVKGTDG